jgi:hypothetical protein
MEWCTHILRDSKDLVSRVTALRGEDLVFYKIDIKDFFLCGSPQELSIEACKNIFPVAKRNLCRRALIFLLERQIVVNPFASDDQDSVYQVSYGSGMGLTHSGETADAALANCMEHGLINSPDALHVHGLVAYYRFKDDILMIGNNRRRMRAMYKQMEARSKFYVLYVEGVSKTEARMLDTLLSYDGNKIESCVAYKDTATDTTLSTGSAHHSQVHMMWPQAYMTRIFNLTTGQGKAAVEMGNFLKRLQRNFSAPEVINAAIMKGRSLLRGDPKKERNQSERRAWLVLPYHPSYAHALNEAVTNSNTSSTRGLWMRGYQNTQNAPPPPRVTVGWCNKHPTLEQWFSR